LRDSRLEFCVFGGEHVIDLGRVWRETDGGASEVSILLWAVPVPL